MFKSKKDARLRTPDGTCFLTHKGLAQFALTQYEHVIEYVREVTLKNGDKAAEYVFTKDMKVEMPGATIWYDKGTILHVDL